MFMTRIHTCKLQTECQWDLRPKSFKCFEILSYIWTFSEGHLVTRTVCLVTYERQRALAVLNIFIF